mmetsp:Transcript_7273/g.9878  ORF Transcript_7273/g.9878 Transcript_7273/m.9878 type:complete len:172 (-) Transcript_7273:3424-3939(-)
MNYFHPLGKPVTKIPESPFENCLEKKKNTLDCPEIFAHSPGNVEPNVVAFSVAAEDVVDSTAARNAHGIQKDASGDAMKRSDCVEKSVMNFVVEPGLLSNGVGAAPPFEPCKGIGHRSFQTAVVALAKYQENLPVRSETMDDRSEMTGARSEMVDARSGIVDDHHLLEVEL